MIEINQGQVRWHITSTDGNAELVVVGKISVTHEQFDEVFFNFYKESETHYEAFEKAETFHEKELGYRKYTSYDAFRAMKSARLNKKK